MTSPPAGDMGAVSEAARMLVAAERPMIIPERYARTPNGVKLLIELAELLQAPVNNRERMNFPNRHPLAGNGGQGYQPDVTLALEVQDVSGSARQGALRGAKTISISSVTLNHKSN